MESACLRCVSSGTSDMTVSAGPADRLTNAANASASAKVGDRRLRHRQRPTDADATVPTRPASASLSVTPLRVRDDQRSEGKTSTGLQS